MLAKKMKKKYHSWCSWPIYWIETDIVSIELRWHFTVKSLYRISWIYDIIAYNLFLYTLEIFFEELPGPSINDIHSYLRIHSGELNMHCRYNYFMIWIIDRTSSTYKRRTSCTSYILQCSSIWPIFSLYYHS